MPTSATDKEGRARLQAFLGGLQQLGWTDDQNVKIDIRWANGSVEQFRAIAADFAGLAPDVIVANSTPATAAVKNATSTIPAVFMMVSDPLAQGFIASQARPGGNITGFSYIDFSAVGKSVDMLKTIAPALTHVGLMFNPQTVPFYQTYLGQLQQQSRLVEVERAAVQSTADITSVIAATAMTPGGGVVVAPDPFTTTHLGPILAALLQHRLPHTVTFRRFVAEGALMSYGPDSNDVCRRAASYVDRILKGEKPADLPVQAPTKFEFAINAKTANALGLEIPAQLLALADEVIE
jgi:putative ABC transport system substrate-binding protein